jgi:hypothetical protein
MNSLLDVKIFSKADLIENLIIIRAQQSQTDTDDCIIDDGFADSDERLQNFLTYISTLQKFLPYIFAIHFILTLAIVIRLVRNCWRRRYVSNFQYVMLALLFVIQLMDLLNVYSINNINFSECHFELRLVYGSIDLLVFNYACMLAFKYIKASRQIFMFAKHGQL